MPEPRSHLAVETHGLARRFGAHEAVRGIDLEVPRGSVFGLIGPNGAGKTTTFALLCGFLRPTAGRALVLGCDPRDRARLGARVGALPQDAPLPPRMRVLDALRYWAELGGVSPGESSIAARRALDAVGLPGEGKRRCGELSHGMTKRVALAQAFLGEPELVFLDEPTAGLDPRSAREVKDLILARQGRTTLVVSSHDLAQLEELCDAVAILDRGRIARQGSMKEVTGQGELVRVVLADPSADRALEALSRMDGVGGARFLPQTRTLEVELRGVSPEEGIPAVLRAVLAADARVLAVSRGRRLEERVLELT